MQAMNVRLDMSRHIGLYLQVILAYLKANFVELPALVYHMDLC